MRLQGCKRREQGAKEGRTKSKKRRKHVTLEDDWGENGRENQGMTVNVVGQDDLCTGH
jgi:hypothetical protein